MIAMDHTIAGAASGETAWQAAPKGSQSQAKGQKSTEYIFVMLIILRITNNICYSYDQEIGGHPISFFNTLRRYRFGDRDEFDVVENFRNKV